MPKPPRVLCITDLACVGRSSLAAIMPVLGAWRVQACPLPTALYSTHTGGFGEVSRLDTAAFGLEALEHFKREQVNFDAIYIGYLGSHAQFEVAERAIMQYPSAFVVVDPAIGDAGKLYTGLDDEIVAHMRALCLRANLITPNYTELFLLQQRPLRKEMVSDAEMELLCRELSDGRLRIAVTGLPREGGQVGVAWFNPETNIFRLVECAYVPQSYPGTGDIFVACLTGALLNGLLGTDAVRAAMQFVREAARKTFCAGALPREGVWFEPFLHSIQPGFTPLD